MGNKFKVYDNIGYFDKEMNRIETGVIVEIKEIETMFGNKYYCYVLDTEIMLLERDIRFIVHENFEEFLKRLENEW